MSQYTLKVGDKVTISNASEAIRTVGLGNIGTITSIYIGGAYAIINWAHQGPKTYKDGKNNNQWNCYTDELKLRETETPVTKKELICNKVKYLQNKFEEREKTYDF